MAIDIVDVPGLRAMAPDNQGSLANISPRSFLEIIQ